MAEERKVILSVKDLEVKFNVRGRILTAIRGVTLDIYENESIAIVGESGSGKSVLTKTFSGMTDENGFISKGDIILRDDEVSKTVVTMNKVRQQLLKIAKNKLNKYSVYENGAEVFNKLEALELEKEELFKLPRSVRREYRNKIKEAENHLIEKQNELLIYDSKTQKEQITKCKHELKEAKAVYEKATLDYKEAKTKRKKEAEANVEFKEYYANNKAKLEKELKACYEQPVDPKKIERNDILAKEIVLSASRYSFFDNFLLTFKLLKEFKKEMKKGTNLTDSETLNQIFDRVNFRVEYIKTLEDGSLEGYCVVNLAKVKKSMDWQKIRGTRISTVFQDPMTSLNPIIKIGDQITNVIMKHQKCSHFEAKKRAIKIMEDVGIDNADKRFDDYPFQYSGGMRQRIVIAIALSCRPKILICDEPTTALDVTIQAQILKLIKKLQKEYQFTTIYITHDLGVVANVADRVVVLYAGQPVEYGTVEDIFYDPRHPYTWALLASLPQLSVKGEQLYSITGTPPSLYSKVKGDAFALRSEYCMAVDLVKEPPYFQVSETHFAKTWLLDPRAPKVEKPKNIQNLHEKLSGVIKKD